MDPVGKTTFAYSSSSRSMCYASAGGMVGGHAPEMEIKRIWKISNFVRIYTMSQEFSLLSVKVIDF